MMKISFRRKKHESKFKKFVCDNKKVLKQFLAFGSVMRNPFVRLIFAALSKALDLVCGKK